MSDEINNKITTVLQSLDGISPAEPKPFLLTRIMAALQQELPETIWSSIAIYLKKPLVAGVAFLLLLVFNIIVLSGRNSLPEKENVAAGSAALNDFAINVSGIYDIENQEP